MTPEQRTEIEFLTINGQRAAAMMQGGLRLQSLSAFLTETLITHANVTFPELAAKIKEHTGKARDDRRSKIAAEMKTKGPVLWAEMHTRALSYDPSKALVENAWLMSMMARLPCGDCQAGYAAYLSDHPATLDSADAYFAWTVELHNAVNIKIGNPTMTVDQARRVWAK